MADQTCGHCHFPIRGQSGMRYFISHVAHQEAECLRLLHAEIERLDKGWADANVTALNLRAELERDRADAARYRALRDAGHLDRLVEPVHPCDEQRVADLIDLRVDRLFFVITDAALSGEGARK